MPCWVANIADGLHSAWGGGGESNKSKFRVIIYIDRMCGLGNATEKGRVLLRSSKDNLAQEVACILAGILMPTTQTIGQSLSLAGYERNMFHRNVWEFQLQSHFALLHITLVSLNVSMQPLIKSKQAVFQSYQTQVTLAFNNSLQGPSFS